MIIGVIGKKGHGKDSVANVLVAYGGFRRVAFGDALKRECFELYGVSPTLLSIEEKEAVIPGLGRSAREVWQAHGDARRAEDPSYWVRALVEEMRSLRAKGQRRLVISDVRYPNEAAVVLAMAEAGKGGQLWRVVRPGFHTEVGAEHSSEMSLDEQDVHVEFENGGSLNDLRDAVLKVFFEYSRAGVLDL